MMTELDPNKPEFDQDIEDGINAEFGDDFEDDDFLELDASELDDPAPADGDDLDEGDDDLPNELEDGDDEPELDDDGNPIEADDDQVLTLADGTDVPMSDIEKAYASRAELENDRAALNEQKEALQRSNEAFKTRQSTLEKQVAQLTAYLETIIPPVPDRALLDYDPAGYVRAKEHREAVLQEIGEAVAISNEVQATGRQLTQEEIEAHRTRETALLTAAMPSLRDAKRLKAFNDTFAKTAKEFKFTDAEIANGDDHRIKLLMHYAAKGKKAEHDGKNSQIRLNKAKGGKSRRPAQTRSRGSITSKRIDKAAQVYNKTGNARAAELLANAGFED